MPGFQRYWDSLARSPVLMDELATLIQQGLDSNHAGKPVSIEGVPPCIHHSGT
jgi:hypothetical protein